MKPEDIVGLPEGTPLLYLIGGSGNGLPVTLRGFCKNGLVSVKCPKGFVRRVAVRHLRREEDVFTQAKIDIAPLILGED